MGFAWIDGTVANDLAAGAVLRPETLFVHLSYRPHDSTKQLAAMRDHTDISVLVTDIMYNLRCWQ